MLIMVEVLSAQQNWDVSTGETTNSLILEYKGWQFSAPISDDDLQGVLAAMRVDAAAGKDQAQPVRTVDFRGVQEPFEVSGPVVAAPAVFAAEPSPDAREDRLAAMRRRAQSPVPVQEVVESDEDGFQQG